MKQSEKSLLGPDGEKALRVWIVVAAVVSAIAVGVIPVQAQTDVTLTYASSGQQPAGSELVAAGDTH